MSVFHSGSRHNVAYVAEVTAGTTPPSPEMTQVPVASVNITPTKDVFNDPSIRSDRSIRFQRHGNVHVAGDLETAYEHGVYDDFLAAALHGTWTSNVLKQAAVKTTFTIERGYTDIDVPFYQRLTGVHVTAFKMDVPVNDVVKAHYTLMGMGQTSASSALDSTPTIPTGKAPMTHLSGTFLEAGSAVGNITAISIDINNGYNENFVLGSSSPAAVTYGYAKVTGQLTVYFDSAAMYNKFINETATSISFEVNDGQGNTHTWSLPNVKFNGMSMPVNNDQAVIASIPFVALYDSVTGTAVQVTRS